MHVGCLIDNHEGWMDEMFEGYLKKKKEPSYSSAVISDVIDEKMTLSGKIYSDYGNGRERERAPINRMIRGHLLYLSVRKISPEVCLH